MFWSEGQWVLCDLGSTNGSFVAGRRLSVGEWVRIEEGAELRFGGDAERWVLVDGGPPVAAACADEGGEIHRAVNGFLPLPAPTNPELTLFEDNEGHWMLEGESGTRAAVDQERVEAGAFGST
ncbi:FHA domain-containing protein [Polyangium fumosum]|uniref:FHA domain-containing protein n=1 Tax=Polyangium fumosum TaxID=889272 RepID=A0A4U1IHA4_9BACT|nr:FHA domain-containing protein [Polyangium fumosum]